MGEIKKKKGQLEKRKSLILFLNGGFKHIERSEKSKSKNKLQYS